jgi:nuclear transport factor 2 (NTF2) superfamily protein
LKKIPVTKEETMIKAYQLFNERKADELLQLMTPDVHWPNGWEGGYVNGRNEVKNYWTRQWKQINPTVIPKTFNNLADRRLEVIVKQTVKDHQGNVLSDVLIKHVYTFKDNLVSEMQIVQIS